MSTVVYDAAVLVAADRSERRAWAEHKARLEFGVVPLVPAPVVAQVSRSPHQAQLRRFLTGCVVVPFRETEAHEAGRLLGELSVRMRNGHRFAKGLFGKHRQGPRANWPTHQNGHVPPFLESDRFDPTE